VVTGALVKEIDDQTTKVSLRSADGINVAAVAAQFGGGGHFNAAGCKIHLPLVEAKKAIIARLTEANGG